MKHFTLATKTLLVIVFYFSMFNQWDRNPIYESNGIPLNRQWSYNSANYLFMDASYSLNGNFEWVNINTDTNLITKSDRHPLHPILSAERKQALNLEYNVNGATQDKIVVYAPNQKYVIYRGTPLSQEADESTRLALQIGNIENGKSILTSILLYSTNINYSFAVRWSGDNTAALITSITSHAGIYSYYIDKIDANLQNIRVTPLQDTRFTGEEYSVTSVGGLSHDGKILLLAAFNRLILYNIETDKRVIVTLNYRPNNQDTTIRFVEDRFVVYISQDILYWYDSLSKTTVTHNIKWCAPDNKEGQRRLYDLSPDGRKVAITLYNDSQGELYICDLPPFPVFATPQPPPNIILPPAQPTLINPLPGGGGE
jgi:hypothetical protein